MPLRRLLPPTFVLLACLTSAPAQETGEDPQALEAFSTRASQLEEAEVLARRALAAEDPQALARAIEQLEASDPENRYLAFYRRILQGMRETQAARGEDAPATATRFEFIDASMPDPARRPTEIGPLGNEASEAPSGLEPVDPASVGLRPADRVGTATARPAASQAPAAPSQAAPAPTVAPPPPAPPAAPPGRRILPGEGTSYAVGAALAVVVFGILMFVLFKRRRRGDTAGPGEALSVELDTEQQSPETPEPDAEARSGEDAAPEAEDQPSSPQLQDIIVTMEEDEDAVPSGSDEADQADELEAQPVDPREMSGPVFEVDESDKPAGKDDYQPGTPIFFDESPEEREPTPPQEPEPQAQPEPLAEAEEEVEPLRLDDEEDAAPQAAQDPDDEGAPTLSVEDLAFEDEFPEDAETMHEPGQLSSGGFSREYHQAFGDSQPDAPEAKPSNIHDADTNPPFALDGDTQEAGAGGSDEADTAFQSDDDTIVRLDPAGSFFQSDEETRAPGQQGPAPGLADELSLFGSDEDTRAPREAPEDKAGENEGDENGERKE